MADINDLVDDATIQTVLKQHDDPDHPDALAIADVRDLLALVQEGAERGWATHMDHVEDGDATVVHEDSEVVILDTGTEDNTRLELEYNDAVDADKIARRVVSTIHHELARDRCDRDWSVTYPYVIAKPELDNGQRYVEAVVNGLQQRGLSPGQAWAYYGVEIRDNSQRSWGIRKGDHDHKNVSDALAKAKQKLP